VTRPVPAAGAGAQTQRRGAFSALDHRNYRLVFTGIIVSNVGTWMQAASQAWLIHELTGRATDLGVLGLARAVPLIVLSLVGGTLADRLDKRRLLYVTQTLAAAFAIVQGFLAQAGWIEVWHIWALGFLSATVLAFDQPTRQAMLPQLVPREDFMSAITLNALTFNGAAVLGPAIAGLLVPVAGYASTFYLNGASFGAVIVALALLRLPPPPSRPRDSGVLRGVAEGLGYVWRHPAVRALTLMAAVFGLFGSPYVLMLPVYRSILGLDERALGFLTSAPGLGTILGGLVLARFAHVRWKGRLLVGSVGLFVATLITFATSRHYALSVAVLIAVGASLTAFTTTTQTLLQRATDDRMRGRVVSMYTTTVIGFQPLGALDLGWAIDRIGAPAALSAAALVVATVALVMAPRLRRLPDW
jgi:predicted MFS family arabinose efflux permease